MYRAPLNADEYCCVSFVSTELADEHPDIAAAFTRAVLKASAYVAAYPEETAKIQIKGEYISGDPAFNAEILKSYKYIPSVQGGYDALVNVANDLHNIGILKPETDVNALIGRSFRFFDDVPDSYTASDATFVEVEYTANTGSKVAAQMNDCCG